MTSTITYEQIQISELARTEALKSKDMAALERILAPDFTYVHASGRTEGKGEYLDAIASGPFRWTDFIHEGTVVRPVADDTALMYGFLHASKQQAGDMRSLLFRFVTVWVRAGDGWKLTFQQNTKPVSPTGSMLSKVAAPFDG